MKEIRYSNFWTANWCDLGRNNRSLNIYNFAYLKTVIKRRYVVGATVTTSLPRIYIYIYIYTATASKVSEGSHHYPRRIDSVLGTNKILFFWEPFSHSDAVGCRSSPADVLCFVSTPQVYLVHVSPASSSSRNNTPALRTKFPGHCQSWSCMHAGTWEYVQRSPSICPKLMCGSSLLRNQSGFHPGQRRLRQPRPTPCRHYISGP
jgi:hypothetical protein